VVERFESILCGLPLSCYGIIQRGYFPIQKVITLDFQLSYGVEVQLRYS